VFEWLLNKNLAMVEGQSAENFELIITALQNDEPEFELALRYQC
jgi:hypothetical protein